MTAPGPIWNLPPADLTLSRHEVHVWRAPLDSTASRVRCLRQTLAGDELTRVRRFFFQKDRRQFIVARGLLRTILGRYLDIAPEQIRFWYSPHGKPALATTPDQDRLDFNLSHSQGLALYAVTRGRAVGIDLERIRMDFDYEQLAARFFSPRETARLRDIPTKLKPQAFFNCWTRKEAYIKARGEGLLLPLNQFDVSLASDEPATLLLNNGGDLQAATHWSLRALTPGPGYVAALAVEGHDWQLKCWQWLE